MTLTEPTTASVPVPTTRAGRLLATLILATAVVTVDNTVLNVALPSISTHLNAGTNQLQWIVNAYSLLFGGLLLTGGTVADRVGRRRVLLGGLTAFLLASACVLFVHTGPELVGLRALVGASAAFVMPSTLAILMRSFDGPRRAAAVGLWGAVSAAGFALGPVLGGLVLDHFAWQGVFLINIPIAGAALLAVLAWVPESADPTGGRLDLPGVLLSIATMVCLVDALVSGPVHGWTSSGVLTAAAATVVAGAGFVLRELRAAHPMVDVRLLARRAFAGPAAAEGALMFSVAGLMFLLTQDLQLVHGYRPLVAGLAVAPAAVGVVLASPVVARLGGRIPAPFSVAVGLGICAGGLVLIATELRTGYWPLAAGLLLFGVGMRLSLTPVALAVVDALPAEQVGMGSALNDTFQEIGGALGVAVLGCVFNLGYRHRLPAGLPGTARASLSQALTLGDPRVAAVARGAFENGMQLAVWCCAGLLVTIAALALRTIPHGARVSED